MYLEYSIYSHVSYRFPVCDSVLIPVLALALDL